MSRTTLQVPTGVRAPGWDQSGAVRREDGHTRAGLEAPAADIVAPFMAGRGQRGEAGIFRMRDVHATMIARAADGVNAQRSCIAVFACRHAASASSCALSV